MEETIYKKNNKKKKKKRVYITSFVSIRGGNPVAAAIVVGW